MLRGATGNADLIPPLPSSALAGAAAPPYARLPAPGADVFLHARSTVSQLGLKETTGGVYVSDAIPGPPPNPAFRKRRDGKWTSLAVDQDGNYEDRDYGRIAVAPPFSAPRVGGKVPFTIFRKGGSGHHGHARASRCRNYVVEPYIIDRAQFAIVGGFVLQELSRQLPQEWGSDWAKKRPSNSSISTGCKTTLQGRPEEDRLRQPRPADRGDRRLNLRMLVVTNQRRGAAKSRRRCHRARETQDALRKIEFDGEPTTIYLDESRLH
jgi:hypothetical protein